MAASASRKVVMLSLPLWRSKTRKTGEQTGRNERRNRRVKRWRGFDAYTVLVEGLKHGQHPVKLGHHMVCDLLAAVHSVRLHALL